MEKKMEKKSQKNSSTSPNCKDSEKGMNRTEFAQEYNLNTDKQNKNCNLSKGSKGTEKK